MQYRISRFRRNRPNFGEGITKVLAPIQKKRRYYQERPKLVEEILFEGNQKARSVAKETLKLAKEKMHLN